MYPQRRHQRKLEMRGKREGGQSRKGMGKKERLVNTLCVVYTLFARAEGLAASR